MFAVTQQINFGPIFKSSASSDEHFQNKKNVLHKGRWK